MSLASVKTSMEVNSFYPTDIIPDGKIQRFNRDSQDRKKSAWYVCHRNHTNTGEEYFVCVYSDWRDGERFTFSSGHTSSIEEKKKVDKQIKLASAKIEKEIARKQEESAIDAEEEFNVLAESGHSKYLKDKGITSVPGIRFNGTYIAVPVRDHLGRFWGYQKISDDGKFFRPGTRVKGNYFRIEGRQPIILCEGVATGISINLATSQTVICAFSANNLPDVAKHFVGSDLTIAADNDKSGAGIEWAKKACELSDKFKIVLAEPTVGSDFNDVHIEGGLDAVREYFDTPSYDLTKPVIADKKAAVNGVYPDSTDKGKPKATLENVEEMFNRLGIIVRYNVIKKEEEYIIPGQSFSLDNQANAAIAHITSWCERVGISQGNLIKYLNAIADKNLYNPVASWIESSPWDGVDRLGSFYRTIVAKDELTNGEILSMKETFIKTWMISAIAAAFKPRGFTSHGVLVLQGDQGLGKTSWFKNLVPDSLDLVRTNVILRPENKDSVLTVISKWIVELGELNATFKTSDIEQLKGFITASHDSIRRPFAVKESQYQRRTVFCGSVNPDQFLRDPTGNRRFWVIPCEDINYEHGLNMQQVWAEFKVKYYDAGSPWYLSTELQDALGAHNEKFQELSPVHERIMHRFDPERGWQTDSLGRKTGTWMTATEVCIAIGIQNPTIHDVRTASNCLKKFFGDNQKRASRGPTFLMPAYRDHLQQIIPNQIYSN